MFHAGRVFSGLRQFSALIPAGREGYWWSCLFVLLISGAPTPGGTPQAAEILRWNHLDSAEIHSGTITVTAPTRLQMSVINISRGGFSDPAGYAWLVDGKSRDEVWSSQDHDGSRYHGSRNLSEVIDTVALDPGTYDLYYFAAVNHGSSTTWNSWKGELPDVVGNVFGDGNSFWNGDRVSELAAQCFVAVSTLSGSATAGKWTNAFPSALFSAMQVGDGKRVRFGFELTKPMSLHLYTLIEMPSGYDDPVDNCWIASVDNFSRVWEASRRSTVRAGGGNKNRRFFGDVSLPAGKYVLNYSTDDSHSFESFNSEPPYDPNYWGVVLLPGPGFDKTAFRSVEVAGRGTPLVDLTRIRNDEYREVPFTLDKAAKVYLVAEGEYAGGADEFADYAWITETKTNRTVWEMTEENTAHAGGASKNRIFEGVVSLPAGSYALHYESDGSHAYHEWNSAEPLEPSAWGVAMYPMPGEKSIAGLTVSPEVDSDRGSWKDDWKGKKHRLGRLTPITVTVPDPPSPPSVTVELPGHSGRSYSSSSGTSGAVFRPSGEVIAAITRVRDDQERHLDFTLQKAETIDIYAIGEGAGEELADYGWIENSKSGQTVWEMDYYETRRAGGASKNRQETATIELPAGSYTLYFVTDGSHSYRNWNADPPRDPENYGITVYKHE